MMIGPSYITSHLDESQWPQEQDHLRRWHFPVRAPTGELGRRAMLCKRESAVLLQSKGGEQSLK